jgi:hypothetical protein
VSRRVESCRDQSGGFGEGVSFGGSMSLRKGSWMTFKCVRRNQKDPGKNEDLWEIGDDC